MFGMHLQHDSARNPIGQHTTLQLQIVSHVTAMNRAMGTSTSR